MGSSYLTDDAPATPFRGGCPHTLDARVWLSLTRVSVTGVLMWSRPRASHALGLMARNKMRQSIRPLSLLNAQTMLKSRGLAHPVRRMNQSNEI